MFYTVPGRAPLAQLMNDALILAHASGHDVFNALDILENSKVGAGAGAGGSAGGGVFGGGGCKTKVWVGLGCVHCCSAWWSEGWWRSSWVG